MRFLSKLTLQGGSSRRTSIETCGKLCYTSASGERLLIRFIMHFFHNYDSDNKIRDYLSERETLLICGFIFVFRGAWSVLEGSQIVKDECAQLKRCKFNRDWFCASI
jgi:hypothetical protein